jgi:hypothetical protein
VSGELGAATQAAFTQVKPVPKARQSAEVSQAATQMDELRARSPQPAAVLGWQIVPGWSHASSF